MNWFDFVIISVVVVVTLVGMKVKLLGAAFTTAGIFAGWILAGHLSDDVGEIVANRAGDSLTADTWITVISYTIIIILALIASGLVWKIVRPLLTVATLGLSGMLDKLGGLALGLVVGLALSGALITVSARLAYDFERFVPEEAIAGSLENLIPDVADKLASVEETRERVEDALVDSALVEVFIDITDAIPGDALGFVPSDFKGALDILELEIKRQDAP